MIFNFNHVLPGTCNYLYVSTVCIDVINGYLKILKGAELSLKFDDDKNVKEYEIQNFRGHEVIYGDFDEVRNELRFF